MYYLVHNPVAGRGRAQKALPMVEAFFAAAGLPLSTFTTRGPGDATQIAAGLPSDARVLALGGDGTVHEVALACIGTERTLGVIPVGTGDDFAFALGLARGEVERALRVIAAGRTRRVDTGRVNGTPFANAFGAGFDADVAHRITTAPRWLRAEAAYLYAVVATLSHLRNLQVTVTVDGQRCYQGPSLLVATQNGPRTGGGFLFAPDAHLDDGQLDVLVAGQFGRLGTLGILPRVMRGTHLSHPKVFAFRGREAVLEWEQPRPAHVEGELLPPAARFTVEIAPRSLRVFCPPEA